jgi:hypothetical protein
MAHLLVFITDEEEFIPDVLDAWQEAGVPGVTMADTFGTTHKHTMRDDLPFVVSLRAVLESRETRTRTLFSVIPDRDVLDKASAAVFKLIPDFDEGHRGIMFVMPLERVWGSTNAPHAHKT